MEEIIEETTEETIESYISELTFNDGEKILIKKNDIIVFVGPNNVGKSQTLEDINNLVSERDNTIIVKGIQYHKCLGDIVQYLEKISVVEHNSNMKYYRGLNYNINDANIRQYSRGEKLGALAPVFVCHMKTQQRLNIVNPPESIMRTQSNSHPIHSAVSNSKYRKWLSDNFERAFGEKLIPNSLFGSIVPLCIGESVNLGDEYVDDQERLEAYAEILDSYKQVQDQGDGIKSFTGILLYLMITRFSTYLLDEPESFLHPPQAQIMGQILGETLNENQQAFISTHSEHILKGLLNTCPERVKIIRITRSENENYFSTLDNNKLNTIWNDSLLRHSNILSGLFYKTVVICESDSDCKMYSIIASYLKQEESKYSEALFVHCGGKQRIAKISSSLKKLGIEVKVIPDIDILNDQIIFKELIMCHEIEWESIKVYYNDIVSNIHSEKEQIERLTVKREIEQCLGESQEKYLSKQEIQSIQNSVRIVSKWKKIKEAGVQGLPSGNATMSFNTLNKILKLKGIHMVPVGELERFIREVGGHGPEWVNQVLEKYPDFKDGVYDNIKKFVVELNL